MKSVYFDEVNECFCDCDGDNAESIILEEEEPINRIIYREMENLFETICGNKYELFYDQHTNFCNIISESENKDDILDNMTFNKDNLYKWFEEQKHSLLFGADLYCREPNLSK